MRFAIVGAGAIGGYLAARLALAGHEVAVVARGRNLEALRRDGLHLRLENGVNLHATTLHAVERMADAGPQDAVLLTVKAHQIGDVAAELGPLYGPATIVVPMVNGIPWWYFHRLAGPHEGRRLESVDPGGRIAAAIASERIVGSVVHPAARLCAPGVVEVVEGNRFTLGEPDGSRSERVLALAQALIGAGFKAPVAKDLRSEIWVKLWGNLSFNPLSALTHATLEELCDYEPTRRIAARMMREAQAVGEALGATFKVSLEQRIAGARAVGAHKTSMLQDLEQGRALELAALVGAVIELGAITGVATPTIEALHAMVSLLERCVVGRQGRLRVEPAG
jgi:2-dehydropantoate 2-reductase